MLNLFQYLKDTKGKRIPFKLRLLNNLLSEHELIINDYLDLSNSKIEKLPDNLVINSFLTLYNSEISKLPNNLYVKNELYIIDSNISELPDDLYVGGNLWCRNTPLGEKINNDLSLLEKYKRQIKGEIKYW